MMGSPKTHPYGLKFKASAILILIISFEIFPSNSDGLASAEDSSKSVKQKKLALGSKPPGCFNKCLGCIPCKAALIISTQHRNGGHRHMASTVHQRDEGYYLLSWKCKCGNKLYEP